MTGSGSWHGPGGRTEARVDLDAVVHNVRSIRRALAPTTRLCAVVKADAYGHGAVPCARAARAGGADWLAVATADEAAALRAGGLHGRVLVLGALSPGELDVALAADADIVAWDERFVAAVAARGGGRIHVKLDTGMGRLGMRDPEQASRLLDASGVEIAGVMTHLATADEDDRAFLDEQLERFAAWVSEVQCTRPGLIAHAANSAAALREPRSHFDMVRTGVAIYGLDPFQGDPRRHELRPAMELVTRVAAVKPIALGQSAGYGRRFVAATPTHLATLPIGYGDGFRRALTNHADLLIRGVRRPVVGTVSMDNITVDVGSPPAAAVGDEAVLLGTRGSERITAEELAGRLGTINYEVTCGLMPRIPRVYCGAGAPA